MQGVLSQIMFPRVFSVMDELGAADLGLLRLSSEPQYDNLDCFE